jgi:hypothetical protein
LGYFLLLFVFEIYLSFFSLPSNLNVSPIFDSKYHRFGLYLWISECSEKCK